MIPAGGAGDRWCAHLTMIALEESPDSAVLGTVRATRLVTPGGGIREDSATDSATETKPPVRIALGGRQEAKPLAGLFRCRTGKGETVG
jgi:hypothetical protein